MFLHGKITVKKIHETHLRRVRQLLCPLLVMHGQRDDIIPFYHGFRLHKQCPKQFRWPAYFPQRAGATAVTARVKLDEIGVRCWYMLEKRMFGSGQVLL